MKGKNHPTIGIHFKYVFADLLRKRLEISV